MPGPQNKTITVTAASAAVNAFTASLQQDGTVKIQAYGSCAVSDGTTLANGVEWVLPSGGPLETAIKNFMNGGALTKWRNANGIEAP